jgi:osmotically-inducible protein OsmY
MLTATTKTDAEIQQDVLKELKWHPRVDPSEIGVQVDLGVVTLTGNVDSYAKKIAARESAHRVAGVLDVADDLVVNLPQLHARTDQDIAHAVRNALHWDVTVPDERIHSTVSQGTVTLEGQVDFWSQYMDTERCVERLAGVRGVNNKITIRLASKVEASRIRKAIEDALDRQAHCEANQIGIIVNDGIVMLTGTVRSWAEKNAVHNLVSFAPGVRKVEDNLTIEW